MEIRYKGAAGKYELIVPKDICLELWLIHNNGQPFTLMHHDREILEEIADKIQQKYKHRSGATKAAIRTAKSWMALYIVLLAASIAGIKFLPSVWLDALLVVASLYFACKAIMIYIAAGAGNNESRETLLLLEFREWLLAYTPTQETTASVDAMGRLTVYPVQSTVQTG